ncbi:hypothetical protein ZHAS_00011627 [Anopheles sinensis]|uniref:Uncharacterized protein n=1 Tax=Anopheles sinensis TaxID=74873 RepID=A0A084W0P3_ANOSI|nr:hypothetical protein ZHAS_00011627 [Anopheles sinensis]
MGLITTVASPTGTSSGSLLGTRSSARRPPAIMQPLAGVLLVAMVYFGHMQTSVLANAQPLTEKIPLGK